MRRSVITMGALALALGTATASPGGNAFDITGGEAIVIRKSGSYTVRRPLKARSDQPLVTIAADDVSLDLNGFTLTGLGGKTGAGIVIDGRANVKVHGGTLRDFGTALDVRDSSNVVLAGLQISGEDLPGLPPETGILLVNSRGVRMTDNVIARTFLGVFVRGGGSGANTIKRNTIAGGENGQLGICYNPAPDADPAVDGPSGDLVAENHISRFRTAIQTSPASRANIFVRNYLGFFDLPFDERTPGSNTIGANLEAALP